MIDGDTFALENGQKVRLIGVDCPESLDPNKPMEYFAEESMQFLRGLIEGRVVELEYGPERTDKYGRLLCYVWLDDTLLVNKHIIQSGHGMAYLRFPHKLEAEFLEAELAARRAPVGMWASPRSQPNGKEMWDEYQTLLNNQGQTTGEKRPWLRDKPAVEKQETSEFGDVDRYIKKTGQSGDETVYITRTGAKYHRGSCSSLRKSKIPISKKDAIARGYGPCARCRP
ncbi:MAG: thermonuclease family protein [Candidatus Zixiibacteriota bacterium]